METEYVSEANAPIARRIASWDLPSRPEVRGDGGDLDRAGLRAELDRLAPEALRQVMEALIGELADASSLEEELRSAARTPTRAHGRFVREGDVWTIEFGEEVVRLRDAKGLHDLANLLAQPNADVPVMELYCEADPKTVSISCPGEDVLLDERALREYVDRIQVLKREREDAEARADLGAIERCSEELDFLETTLSRATGLAGRSRRTAGPSERARKAVSNRIRASIRRISKAAPELGAHLEQSIQTGSRCGYRPIDEVEWGF